MTKKKPANLNSLEPLSADEIDDAMFRIRDRLWAELADLYLKLSEESGLTYADLGRRIGRSRSQVQRWLDAPINMTLSSAGLLAEGLNADPEFKLLARCEHGRENRAHPCEEAKAQLVYTTILKRHKTPEYVSIERNAETMDDTETIFLGNNDIERKWVLHD